MENTKLIKFLSSFTKDEFKKFGEFTASPYFNKIKHVIDLYGSIKEYYPKLSGKCFTKENIFKKVFPGEQYNYARLRVLNSRLLALAEKFKAYQKYSFDEPGLKLDILKSLNPLSNPDIYKENLSSAAKLLAKSNPKDEFYYSRMHELISLKNISLGHFNRNKNTNAEIEYLVIYFIVSLLKIYTTALNSRKSVNLKLDCGLMEKLTFIINDTPYSENPLIKIHYNLYLLAGDMDNEEYFFRHLRLTEQYPPTLSAAELYESYKLLLNFCVLKIQNGFNEFAEHKFNLYKSILDKKLHLSQGKYLQFEIFNNVVSSALETGNSKWAEKFIEKYKNILHESYKADVVNICYAKLYYHIKLYDNALKHLMCLSNNENPYYKLSVKDLTIKIFYEMGHYENIISIIDSYKHFLSKNKFLNKEIKKTRNDFLNILNRLMKLKLNFSREKSAEFKNLLVNSPPFPNKDWILEKIHEMEPV